MAASFLCMVLLLLLYRRRVACVSRYARACDAGKVDDSADGDTTGQDGESGMPPVSVIVYSNNEAERLASLLPQLLAQQYDAPFEVIVINDGKTDATRTLVERMQLEHNNLYLSFTPDDTRNLSRKKLSLTIGIKAARHDVLVLTCADALVESPRWLSAMARHFRDESTEVVIGYAAMDVKADRHCGKRFRSFDMASTAMEYLSAAILGKPYRGCAWNLAYRRDVFFNNKGFSRTLNLHYGDDDLFVNEVAYGGNTAVELSQDSIVAIHHGNDQRGLYRELRARYRFTSRMLDTASHRFFGFCSALVWAWLLSTAAAVVADWSNVATWAVEIVVALALWIPLAIAWRRTGIVLGARRPAFTLPGLMLRRPVSNFFLRLRLLRHRSVNYTWQHR